MKKILPVVFVIVALFATIAAAPMASSVTFVGVSNGGGGPMFIFRVDGPVNLSGVVHSVQGEYQGDFPISCVQQDETTVVCHAPKKLSGSEVTVEFNGVKAWVQIPEEQNPVKTSYCYGYYEPSQLNGNLEAGPEAGWVWNQLGSTCQDKPAKNGDISTYSGDPYIFRDSVLPDSHNYNPGPAYYQAAR